MEALIAGDRDRFLDREAEDRLSRGMPPFGRLAALIVSGPHEPSVRETARALARAAPRGGGIEVLGPAPAPLAILRGNAIDATDDAVHGKQEGRFFHGYYDHYCFLPLYVFCGERLLVSYLRPSKIDGAKHAWAILVLLVKKLRQAWPGVRIVFRGDGGFCRHKMLGWCRCSARSAPGWRRSRRRATPVSRSTSTPTASSESGGPKDGLA